MNSDRFPFGGGCGIQTGLEDMGLAAGCYKDKANVTKLSTMPRKTRKRPRLVPVADGTRCTLHVHRPHRSRQKAVQVGMKVYCLVDGISEARYRAPKGAICIGIVVEAPTSTKPALVEFRR